MASMLPVDPSLLDLSSIEGRQHGIEPHPIYKGAMSANSGDFGLLLCFSLIGSNCE